MLHSSPSAAGLPPLDKRSQILRGAMQAFLQQGYTATSMDRVAALAGVSKQTLYSHFQDKEGLFTGLIHHMAGQRFQLVFQPQLWVGDPQKVLSELAHTFLYEIGQDEEYLAFMRLLVGESGRFPALAEVFITTITRPGHRLLANYLALRPEVQGRDPESCAWIFMGTLISTIVTQHILQASSVMPLDKTALMVTLVAMVLGDDAPKNGTIESVSSPTMVE